MNNVSAIIKEMSIKERTDGRYEGRLTCKGYRKSFYGKTKAEVKIKAKEYLMRVENGYREPKKIRFEDYAEYWLKTYKYGRIEPSSYTRLYRVFDTQIRNTLGKMYIGDITTKEIQAVIDEYANPSTKDGKQLAISGLKKILQLFYIYSCHIVLCLKLVI